jgi:hypothetical protein
MPNFGELRYGEVRRNRDRRSSEIIQTQDVGWALRRSGLFGLSRFGVYFRARLGA